MENNLAGSVMTQTLFSTLHLYICFDKILLLLLLAKVSGKLLKIEFCSSAVFPNLFDAKSHLKNFR